MKRFRFGLLIGFALGYWFGTKAGRERHRQLSDLLHRAKESEKVAAAADKAKDLVETGVEKGKGLVDHVRSDDADNDTADLRDDPGPEPASSDSGRNGSTTSRNERVVGQPIGQDQSVNPGLPTPEIN